MSIKPVPPETVETFSLLLHPKRSFSSSSAGVVTGSVYVFAGPSPREKDPALGVSAFVDSRFGEDQLETYLADMRAMVANGTSNVSAMMERYFTAVNGRPTAAKNSKVLEIVRYAPSTQLTTVNYRKLILQDKLMPYYRAHRPSCNFGYTNYNSLNFFTASSVPSDAAWVYPNVVTGSHTRGCYSPTGSFTFEFFINPRYTTDDRDGSFKAGTILHLSSSYALSLVSGTSKGPDGKTDGFRLLLQLSSSADVVPSLATPGSGASARAYLSSDNSLRANKWHHVLVTWGTSAADAGTGSFYVDGVRQGTFVYPSSSVLFPTSVTSVDALFVGNFYEGNNTGTSALSYFFTTNVSQREGLTQMVSTFANEEYPVRFAFKHQLNAEIHDLSIREEYVPYERAVSIGQADLKYAPRSVKDYLLYVPPFFVPGTPSQKVVNGQGGLLNTPFYARNGAYEHPFSERMAFGVAGHYSSLDNFTKDFATGNHARLLHLSMSTILGTTSGSYTANEYLYLTGNVRLRNLQALPCDDGKFAPNFELASSRDLATNPRFVDDLGTPDQSTISLRNMSTGSIYASLFHQTGSVFNLANGSTPEAPTSVPSDLLAVYQRTRDGSSNEIAIFDVSSLFYGERIRPGSLSVTDSNVSGSDGKVKVTLRDDGLGGLYRANSLTPNATWSCVGNVFYEEGLVLVKTPMVPFFGKGGFSMEFDGEKTTHVMKMNVLVDATSFNTSSNTSWSPALSASFDVNREPENQRFVTISGINFHDEDLNILMRTQLAQPLVKRYGDRYLIKVSYDL